MEPQILYPENSFELKQNMFWEISGCEFDKQLAVVFYINFLFGCQYLETRSGEVVAQLIERGLSPGSGV